MIPIDIESFQEKAESHFSESVFRGYPEQAREFFTWPVTWSEIENETEIKGEVKEIAGLNFRLVLQLKNISLGMEGTVSLYLQQESEVDYACVEFVVGIQTQEGARKVHFQQYRFKGVSEYGLRYYSSMEEIKEYVKDDVVEFLICLRVLEDETGILMKPLSEINAKEVTGHVGLRNQGATCYMNSILQSLFFTNYFRNAVYMIPIQESSVTEAIQKLFYFMEKRDQAVETMELTTSFGWNTVDSFAQHDVQEFLRVLMDKLEEKMKKTEADGKIQELFVGKMKSYIKCTEVEYESAREEDFYDIQLNVKDMKNVLDSFRNYCEEEILDMENKYQTEEYGLQRAIKGVKFTVFPPVLHLQLKRFEFDFASERMVKINDRFEFPVDLDLSEFVPNSEYQLHGVLVHTGHVDGGHYTVFVRPKIENKWIKFNDDVVLPVPLQDVTMENYGGEKQRQFVRRFTNAYMLVYIKKDSLDKVLCDVSIPSTQHEKLEYELQKVILEEKQMSDRMNQIRILIFSDEDLQKNKGLDLCSMDLEPKILETSRQELKMDILKQYSPTASFFLFEKRSYGFRPGQRLYSFGLHHNQIYLYEDKCPNPDPIVFIKFFKNNQLELKGHIHQRLVDLDALKQKLNLNFECDFFEEKQTLSQLQKTVFDNGDVIVIQKSGDLVEEYYHELQQIVCVEFISKDSDTRFWLHLNKSSNYNEIASAIALRIGVSNPLLIKLYSYFQHDIPYNSLTDIIMMNQTLYYEVLMVPINQLDEFLKIKVFLIPKHQEIQVSVKRNGTIRDLMQQLGNVILLDTMNSRILREFQETDPICSIHQYSTIVACSVTRSEKMIEVYHFEYFPHQCHGIPFLFPVLPNEVFLSFKQRLLLFVADRDVKVHFVPRNAVSNQASHLLEDNDVVFDFLEQHKLHVVGIEHKQKSCKYNGSLKIN